MRQIAATRGVVWTAAATSRLLLFCRCDMSHEFKPVNVWIRATDRSDKILLQRRWFSHVTRGDLLQQPVAATCRSDLSHCVSALIESAHAQLNGYLTVDNLNEPLQSRCKAFHSTGTALVTVMNDVILLLDKGENNFHLLLDLSAAFDTVNHSLLLSRLENSFRNGITESALHLFQSYFSQWSIPVCSYAMHKCSLHNERSHSGGSTRFCSGPHIIPIIYFHKNLRSWLSYFCWWYSALCFFYVNGLFGSKVPGRELSVWRRYAQCWINLNELKFNHDKTEILLNMGFAHLSI